MKSSTNMKERILNTVVAMILENQDVEHITVRDIAAKSKVNIAMINYYFESKEKLIYEAVDVCLSTFTRDIKLNLDNSMSSREKIKKMIIDIADFSFKTNYLSKISFKKDLDEGSINTAQIILPALKKIFPDDKVTDLKILALQLIVPIQVLYLNYEKYNSYLYINLESKEERDLILLEMIDKFIN